MDYQDIRNQYEQVLGRIYSAAGYVGDTIFSGPYGSAILSTMQLAQKDVDFAKKNSESFCDAAFQARLNGAAELTTLIQEAHDDTQRRFTQ